MLVREPWAGVTPALYASLSDRQLIEVYFAPRDDEGVLIPEGKRQHEERPGTDPATLTGLPENGLRELPSREALAIPREALTAGIPADWVHMFWQVWRGRGLSAEATLAKFHERVGRRR